MSTFAPNGASGGWVNPLFYTLKPYIPRQLQIMLRRRVARRKLAAYNSDWLIVEQASTPPAEWQGWPDGKQFAFVLRHDVETIVGHDRALQLRDTEQRLGMKSSFNFVPERYNVSAGVRADLVASGFEVGVHGLNHDGKLYQSKSIFRQRAQRINHYLHSWNSVGFCAPASHHVLEWNHLLDIEYDSSTFDVAPFEPQSDSVDSIFPFWVDNPDASHADSSSSGYMELPYTLTQDFYAFIILQEETTDIWKRKLDWIAEKGGMALLISHPDYICFGPEKPKFQEYPVALYEEFLDYVRTQYAGQYWHALPKDVAAHCKPMYTADNVGISADLPISQNAEKLTFPTMETLQSTVSG